MEHRAKKRFGQNFLVDTQYLDKIVAAAEVSPEDNVLEIGMGTGILTEPLAQRCKHLTTVEIDKELFPQTKEKLEKYMNVNFILGDFLEKASEIFAAVTGKIKVIANIPYYITTPIIEELLKYQDKISTITLMVQHEVAERMAAGPGTKEYGSLTIFVQYQADVKYLFSVPPTAFRPRPEVTSAVIQIIPRPPIHRPGSEALFFKMVRGAFWGRRKTLRNTLKQSPYTHYTNEMLDKLTRETGIDLQRRGETLSLEEFAKLASVKF